jgi:hypothetical protein
MGLSTERTVLMVAGSFDAGCLDAEAALPEPEIFF